MGHIAPFIIFLVSTQHYASAFIVPTSIKSSSHAAPLHRRRTQHGASGVFKSSGVLDTPSALNKCRSVDATRMFSSSSGSNSFGGLESDGSLTTRGGFAKAVAASGLAALLAGAPSVAEGASKRTVVVTGANSGLGLDAATKLVRWLPMCADSLIACMCWSTNILGCQVAPNCVVTKGVIDIYPLPQFAHVIRSPRRMNHILYWTLFARVVS